MRTFDDGGSAELARHRLTSAGIRVRVVGAQTVVGADLPTTTRGVRLFVDETDLEDASSLLGPDHAVEVEADDDEPGPRCPRCESSYVSERWSTFENALGVALFGVPLKWMQKKLRCGKCGHAWVGAAPLEHHGATGYRSLPRRQGDPVFRLRRGHAVAGIGVGLVGALLLAVLTPHVGVIYFVLAPLAGALLGGGAQSFVCSKPGCRAHLSSKDARCPRCDGTISGTISRPEEHFARKAAWHRGAETLDE